MNRLHRLILMLGLALAGQTFPVHAQDAADGEEAGQRVQYQLVLPDEKTPETVKPEEHNPFESESEALSRTSPGDTEENRVRDKLLKLPVVGVRRMADGGMRVLLGNISLETGKAVPPVLQDQMVELKVKNITSEYIELAWQEKRATGLPPKLMIIPINIGPKIRYQMLGQGEEEGKTKGPNAIMDMALHGNQPQPANSPATAAAKTAPPRAGKVEDDESPPPTPSPLESIATSPAPAPTAPVQATVAPPAVETPPAPAAVPASASPPPSPAVESVVRMLFGNPTPAPK